MKKWEYTVIKFEGEPLDHTRQIHEKPYYVTDQNVGYWNIEKLNELGRQGWELVSITADSSASVDVKGIYHAFFKREISN